MWKKSTMDLYVERDHLDIPSERDLGDYKAIIKESLLLTCLPPFLHVIEQSGLTLLRRKCNTVYILLKKIQTTKYHKTAHHSFIWSWLQSYLKLTWVRVLHDGQQHGSTPQRKATDSILMLMQLPDRPLSHPQAQLNFDNEARACYDWIIVTLGMLAARSLLGIPETADQTLADCLTLTVYK